jgi:hypothetical protein
MRRVLKIALATAVLGFAAAAATPANATVEVSSSPNTGCATGPLAPPADYCAGYYSDNLLSGSPADLASQQTAIQLLPGFSSFTVDSALWNSLVAGGLKADNGNLTDLNNLLAGAGGQVLLGLHWGNVPGDPYQNVSAFYLWNNAAPGSIHLTNTTGWSNAVLYRAGGVPEPATWGMMLLGFAGIGFAMRRSRRSSGALMQIA